MQIVLNLSCPSLMTSPGPVVPHRSVTPPAHFIHLPSPHWQVVARRGPQRSVPRRTRPAGPPLLRQPHVFHEACHPGRDQRREEEELTRASDAVRFQRDMTFGFAVTEGQLLSSCQLFKINVTSLNTPCMDYWTLKRCVHNWWLQACPPEL